MEYYSNHLSKIFLLHDANDSGFLARAEFEKVIKSLNINISQFQLESLLSELNCHENGMIEYGLFVPVCADLLSVRFRFLAKDVATEFAA